MQDCSMNSPCINFLFLLAQQLWINRGLGEECPVISKAQKEERKARMAPSLHRISGRLAPTRRSRGQQLGTQTAGFRNEALHTHHPLAHFINVVHHQRPVDLVRFVPVRIAQLLKKDGGKGRGVSIRSFRPKAHHKSTPQPYHSPHHLFFSSKVKNDSPWASPLILRLTGRESLPLLHISSKTFSRLSTSSHTCFCTNRNHVRTRRSYTAHGFSFRH